VSVAIHGMLGKNWRRLLSVSLAFFMV